MKPGDILSFLPLTELTRIDVGLEGDWSPTVCTVWDREMGLVGFGHVTREHQSFKPSLELYFSDSWVGFHCYKVVEREYVFDEQFVREVIAEVEAAITHD